ncbi:MAG: hypothetical protein H7201_02055 [Candidatus Saccharibacteria bacterium]|nr:hypothetical protein [Microbacteriaceae bacterium]
MRGLSAARLRREDGAVAVIVATAMVVLLGAAAFTVDMGAIYSERAQLQNGADASALAIAQNCAAGTCGNMQTTAQNLANLNSNDQSSNVSVASPAANSVRVTTSTRNAKTGAATLPLTFAPILGKTSKSVSAAATAAWGNPATGPSDLGLAFAPCIFQLNGAIQVIGIAGGSVNLCASVSPSGKVLPGGFNWLADPTATCSSQASTLTGATGGSTGVSISSACSAKISAMAGQVVLLPVYSDASGTGSGAHYVISGWAAFKVLGWNFVGSGGTSLNNNLYLGAKCTGNCKGLIGQFISFVSLDDRFTMGGANLGASIVALSG